MKTKDSGNPHEPLGAVLKEWRVESSLPPRFQERVWRRIERTGSLAAPSSLSLVKTFASWVTNHLARPGFAIVYVIVLVAVGASVGRSQARHVANELTNDLSARYVQAVDPYQSKP